jgi:6-pyruvoyltetrahydropterin/6-carboxytetrahydropterin synthase
MVEIFKEFTFEAAHHLGDNVDPGHIYANIHGHSFHVTITLEGEINPETGWVEDFAVIDRALQNVRAQVDHKFLNNIEGFPKPTLENICKWIFESVEKTFPLVTKVMLRRGTCFEGCIYKK